MFIAGIVVGAVGLALVEVGLAIAAYKYFYRNTSW